MKKVLCLIFLFVYTANAADTSYDTDSRLKTVRDSSVATKGFVDKRKTESFRISDSYSKGRQIQSGETQKIAGQASKGGSIDIVLPLDAVYADVLAELSLKNKSVCSPLTNPLYAADFGLSSEEKKYPGVFNSTFDQALQTAARSNAPIKQVAADEDKIRAYMDCLAWYGAVIGQASINLSTDLDRLKAAAKKDGAGNIIVDGVGYDDFLLLAEASLYSVNEQGLTNKTLSRLFDRALAETKACRFAGSPDRIQCGGNIISLNDQTLNVSNVRIFGQGTFGGFSASYKLNAAWSYSAGIERMKSSSRFAKTAHDTISAVDDAVAKGKGVDAVLTMKKTVDLGQVSKQSANPSRYMPNIQGQ